MLKVGIIGAGFIAENHAKGLKQVSGAVPVSYTHLDVYKRQLVAFGEHGEWNPLMRGLVGTPYFAFYKLLLIPTGLMFLWLVRKWAVPKLSLIHIFTAWRD